MLSSSSQYYTLNAILWMCTVSNSHGFAILPTNTNISTKIQTSTLRHQLTIATRTSDDDNDIDILPLPLPLPVTGVTLKMAFDANYAVADNAPPSQKSERFTCPQSLDLVHKLRRNSDAVLVGRGTVVRDDCTLTVRRVGLLNDDDGQQQQQPARVVIDPQLKILDGTGTQEGYALLRDGHRTIIYHNAGSGKDIENEDVMLVHLSLSTSTSTVTTISPKDIMKDLQTNRNIHHVMVEGGPATALQFLSQKLVDRAMIIRAPSVTFVEPIESGMDDDTFTDAGLIKVGSEVCGDDMVDYWVRREDDDGEVSEKMWPGSTISTDNGWPY
mmetsp:Transcript_5439/g.8096  ORF Transcript_5439/g.8096 Transcript_5439/m.8096 type:complete len:328 (-) Transcript_5439:295-1278(-)